MSAKERGILYLGQLADGDKQVPSHST